MARGPSPQRRAADRRRRRRLADVVLDRLGERYDRPTWAGPRVDAVSELVLTILSQNTADTNSFRAFTALRAAYPGWDAVLAAPTDEVVDVIRPGGLGPTKGRNARGWRRLVRQLCGLRPSLLAMMPRGDRQTAAPSPR
jgi:endonuclease-3